MPEVVFKNVDDSRMRELFLEVVNAYPELKQRTIILRRTQIRRSTMRAQPVLNTKFFFRKSREYRVDYSRHNDIITHTDLYNLPDEVLIGWIAHEIGHVIDYLKRPWLGMLTFGIKYALRNSYLRKAEKRADTIAIHHGFAKEISATKRFLLSNISLPEKYMQRLENYYLSPDEIEGIHLAWQLSELNDISIVEPLNESNEA